MVEAFGWGALGASALLRDFMRPLTGAIYGIPSERVIGSSTGLRYQHDVSTGTVVYLAEMDVFDDGPIEAGPDLEPNRPAADPGRWKLERRHPDAPARRKAVAAGAPPARPP
jgi:hypothetical protein